MQKNVGNLDRIVRAVAGLGLLGFAVLSDSPAHAWGYLGVVPLLTAAIGSCPLYSLIGINTCPAKR
jgi:hypothetical protein